MARNTVGLNNNNVFKPASTQSDALRILGQLLAKRSIVASTLSENSDDISDQESYLQRQKTTLAAAVTMLTAWLNLPDV